MRYYQVDVLAAKGSQNATFTYHFTEALPLGTLVQVPLGPKKSLGIIKARESAPDFTTRAIEKVLPTKPLPKTYRQLADWLASYYASPLGRIWQTMLPQASLRKSLQQARQRATASKPSPLKLTYQQQRAVDQIINGGSINYLLHGATGSGKTQVYIELAKAALESGQSVIILVPEIALTPQITDSLVANFGSRVLLTHSGLSSAKRRDVWLAGLSSGPWVVVGPRSALFTPLAKLGFVIIDEAHDSSYKQDQSPRYHAQAAGAYLATISSAKLVLGTATPTIDSMYLAQKGKLQLVEMTRPVFKADLKPPLIVDLKMRQNLKRSHLLSEPLLNALEQTLQRRKQTILFLNRRGSARLVLCNNCGWQADCPRCHIPLTWHSDQGRLVCHWCGYHSLPPASCPQCQSFDIRYIGSGTKHLEAELKKYFPRATLSRLDKDSFNPKTISRLYGQLKEGQIDILLGTQMITKGLDLPGVETVGVILADNGLYVPDFSAIERTFQLLYQVSGRAGRRSGSLSNVIIQTYSPTHPAITAAANRDYDSFYKYELGERRSLGYPPYAYLLKLLVAKPSQTLASRHAQTQASQLANKYQGLITVIGPAPAWQEQLGGRFHWQIIVKSKHRRHLLSVIKGLPAGWTYDLDPIDLL